MGQQALTAVTGGGANTAVGRLALQLCTGSHNTAVGRECCRDNTTGNYNTMVGRSAAENMTTGSNNTCLGANAGRYSDPFALTSQDNRVVIGDGSITNAYITVDWTIVSDKRDKVDFGEVPHGLDFVNKLKPKSFWRRKERGSDEKQGPQRYGFVAQDIIALEGDNPIIIDNEQEEKLKYTESHLIPVLVKAIQDLSAENTALKARLDAAGL